MMVGVMGTSIASGLLITKTGRYKLFPIVGTVIVGIAMILMTTLTASTPIWLICTYLFLFGVGLGCIMQVVVLVVQNAVPASDLGTATSTNNYFREMGAALGIAVFGTLFTTRLTENLTKVFTDAGATAEQAGQATSTIDPAALNDLPDAIRTGVVDAYADALAPVFWYLVPFIAVALILSIFLKEIPLSDVAGLVARGEAIGGEEAERLEAEQRAAEPATRAGGRGVSGSRE
jgi:MFS family permease